ncbi:MAG: 2-oxoacid:ferredoxin oxidoreductase subunit gamma [Thermoplasmata archaeon]|nr:2-oxoacid:ferredoxin oxidoreductase subunit gamma [Thermoplasmata archaeon]
MSRKEVRVGGFGGQGIILAGFILGKAVAIYEEKEAVQTQSYGPEARGGSCHADVIISDEDINYPMGTVPDVLVLMSQDAFNEYHGKIADDAILIVDEDLVDASAFRKKNKVFKAPATRIAEELGKKIVANIVMLGFLAAVADVVSHDAMKKSVLDSVPKGTEDLNLEAFEKGYEYGKHSVAS